MSEPEHKDETRLDRMERWFRNEPIFSVVILVGLSITGVSEVVKHGSDLLVATGLKQERTLELARDTALATFGRTCMEMDLLDKEFCSQS